MNCKKSRELIITDYLDGEMGEKEKACIEEHMAGCPECRKFYTSSKKAAVEPFLSAKPANPPEYVWRRIRETILSEKEAKRSFWPDIFERVKTFICIPRPVLAIVSVVILVITIGTMARFISGGGMQANMAAPEQFDYFNYLTSSSANSSTGNGAGLGTAIEQYFM